MKIRYEITEKDLQELGELEQAHIKPFVSRLWIPHSLILIIICIAYLLGHGQVTSFGRLVSTVSGLLAVIAIFYLLERLYFGPEAYGEAGFRELEIKETHLVITSDQGSTECWFSPGAVQWTEYDNFFRLYLRTVNILTPKLIAIPKRAFPEPKPLEEFIKFLEEKGTREALENECGEKYQEEFHLTSKSLLVERVAWIASLVIPVSFSYLGNFPAAVIMGLLPMTFFSRAFLNERIPVVTLGENSISVYSDELQRLERLLLSNVKSMEVTTGDASVLLRLKDEGIFSVPLEGLSRVDKDKLVDMLGSKISKHIA